MQMAMIRMQLEVSQSLVSLNEVVRVQHGEVLDVSHMTEAERKVHLNSMFDS